MQWINIQMTCFSNENCDAQKKVVRGHGLWSVGNTSFENMCSDICEYRPQIKITDDIFRTSYRRIALFFWPTCPGEGRWVRKWEPWGLQNCLDTLPPPLNGIPRMASEKPELHHVYWLHPPEMGARCCFTTACNRGAVPGINLYVQYRDLGLLRPMIRRS